MCLPSLVTGPKRIHVINPARSIQVTGIDMNHISGGKPAVHWVGTDVDALDPVKITVTQSCCVSTTGKMVFAF
ncbi:hypothetical protein R3P38DRAFT_1202919 [Favolaschia claudopus]|uniref:Uncharacterized protein n=1 Tax=Favolaschia claudopus TaxID=2862362 RepID=A0AAW0B451_9AGAR